MKGVQLKVKTGTGKSRDREGGSRAAADEKMRRRGRVSLIFSKEETVAEHI